MEHDRAGKRDVARTGAATGLIGVYRSEGEASAVAEQAVALGASAGDVHVGDGADEQVSLVAEMQEETKGTWGVPPVNVSYPKEATKATALATVLLVGAFVLVSLPFAFIPFGGLEWWGRLIVVVIAGALLGGTIAFIAGPAMGLKRPDEPLAADRGVTVRVSPASDEVAEMMASHHPIRLDRYSGDDIETVATEDLSKGKGIVDEVKRSAENPRMETQPGRRPPAT